MSFKLDVDIDEAIVILNATKAKLNTTGANTSQELLSIAMDLHRVEGICERWASALEFEEGDDEIDMTSEANQANARQALK